MDILNNEIKSRIESDIIAVALKGDYSTVINEIAGVLDELYNRIPESKRISYGRVYTVRVLSEYLYRRLVERDMPAFEIAAGIFANSNDYKGSGVALGVLSFHALKDYQKTLPYFESAAASTNWDIREMAQMFFRKLIKKHPDRMREYLLRLVKSTDPNIRRFVGETLRPVQENRWFYNNPDYPLSVLRYMFRESSVYPRTSVGNNLSDLARRLPDLVYGLVKELVASSDKNSYWIAYRACRNLVKKEPVRVMDLLQVDEYKYKDRVFRRSDY
jgi:3-methyladenine DNA glycosylase AlkC